MSQYKRLLIKAEPLRIYKSRSLKRVLHNSCSRFIANDLKAIMGDVKNLLNI